MQEKEDVSASRLDTLSTRQVTHHSTQSPSADTNSIISSNTNTTAKQIIMDDTTGRKVTNQERKTNRTRPMSTSSSYTSFPSQEGVTDPQNATFKRVRGSANHEDDSGNITTSYEADRPVSERSHLLSIHLQHPDQDRNSTPGSNHGGSHGFSEDYLASSSRSLDSSHRVQVHPIGGPSVQGQQRSRQQMQPKKKCQRMIVIDDELPVMDELDPVSSEIRTSRPRFDRNVSLNQSELDGHYDRDMTGLPEEDDELEGSASDHNIRGRGGLGLGDSFPSDHLDPRPEFTSSYNPQTRDRFRRKLRYFFMNPLDKYRTKGKLPWKLGLQVVKIIVVTLQLLIFGSHMSKYLTHQGNMVVTFRELFMSNWDPVREVMTYPPSAGPYAVYTKDEFYKHVNNAIAVYAGLTTSAIGLFGYAHNVSMDNPMSPISLCKEHYTHGMVIPSKFFYNYTNIRSYDCLDIVNATMMPGDPVSILCFLTLEKTNSHVNRVGTLLMSKNIWRLTILPFSLTK